MAAIVNQLKIDLRDDEFCEGYSESFLDSYVATQIKVLREEREMTQKQLAQLLNTSQTVISRIESINYSAWNIGTLKRLARAFKVRLKVSFETCGSLVDDFERFSRTSLQRVPRDRDPILFDLPSAFDPGVLTGLLNQQTERQMQVFNEWHGQVVSRGTRNPQRDFKSQQSLSPVVSNTRTASRISTPSRTKVPAGLGSVVNG
jgi:transcriptional regulator with XRE-family HTH domain